MFLWHICFRERATTTRQFFRVHSLTQSSERLHLHRHLASVGPSPPQLPVVPVAPGPDVVVVRDAEGLGVAAPCKIRRNEIISRISHSIGNIPLEI